MVWKAAQSELYSAVERNNRVVLNPPNAAVVVKKSAQNENAQIPQTGISAQPREQSDTPPKTAEKTRAPKEPVFADKSAARAAPAQSQSPLGAIFSDKDALILCALIFLLWQEKADIKLIAALAFVLLT